MSVSYRNFNRAILWCTCCRWLESNLESCSHVIWYWTFGALPSLFVHATPFRKSLISRSVSTRMTWNEGSLAKIIFRRCRNGVAQLMIISASTQFIALKSTCVLFIGIFLFLHITKSVQDESGEIVVLMCCTVIHTYITWGCEKPERMAGRRWPCLFIPAIHVVPHVVVFGGKEVAFSSSGIMITYNW